MVVQKEGYGPGNLTGLDLGVYSQDLGALGGVPTSSSSMPPGSLSKMQNGPNQNPF